MGKSNSSIVGTLTWVFKKIRYLFSGESRRYQCPACWHSWIPSVAWGADRCPECNYDLHLYNARRNALRNRVIAVASFLSIVAVALVSVAVVAGGFSDSISTATKQHSAVLPDRADGPMDEFQESLTEEMRIRNKYSQERDWRIPANYWRTLNRVWMALSFQREREELKSLEEQNDTPSVLEFDGATEDAASEE